MNYETTDNEVSQIERNQPPQQAAPWMGLTHPAERKSRSVIGYPLYVSIYVSFWKDKIKGLKTGAVPSEVRRDFPLFTSYSQLFFSQARGNCTFHPLWNMAVWLVLAGRNVKEVKCTSGKTLRACGVHVKQSWKYMLRCHHWLRTWSDSEEHSLCLLGLDIMRMSEHLPPPKNPLNAFLFKCHGHLLIIILQIQVF